MDPQILVALIASLTSLAVAVGAFPLTYLLGKRARREQGLDVMAYYRDPLLQAAFDLRSRLRAILDGDFLSRYLVNGNETQKRYARTYTLFVLAEFLCWVEVLRQEVSFLDLGDDARNRQLMKHLTAIRRVLLEGQADPLLRVVNGYQRALGELMIRETDPSRARSKQCIGYAEFCARLESDQAFARWFGTLDSDITELADRENPRTGRLTALENALTGLIDFLDPDRLRYPMRQPGRPTETTPE